MQQPNIDYNVNTKYGESLAQLAVRKGEVKCVETLAAQERCDCWNVPDRYGDFPIIDAVKDGKIKIRVGIHDKLSMHNKVWKEHADDDRIKYDVVEELRNLDNNALQIELLKYKKEYFNLRFQMRIST